MGMNSGNDADNSKFFYRLVAEYVEVDVSPKGVQYGYAGLGTVIDIPGFSGTRKIKSMGTYPIQYYEGPGGPEGLRTRLVERARDVRQQEREGEKDVRDRERETEKDAREQERQRWRDAREQDMEIVQRTQAVGSCVNNLCSNGDDLLERRYPCLHFLACRRRLGRRRGR